VTVPQNERPPFTILGQGGFDPNAERSLDQAVDPVCGMTVDPVAARAAGLAEEQDGVTFYFCGKGCLLEFRDEPAKYLNPGYSPSM
jgi:YHS domain-containing protein